MSVDLANIGMRIMPADLPQAAPPATGAGESSSFADSLRDAVSEVDNASLDARYKVSSLIENGGADVHDAMVAVENIAATNLTNAEQARNATVQAAASLNGMSLMDYLSTTTG
jgi:flagellar hook-basal body complex protein FliE